MTGLKAVPEAPRPLAAESEAALLECGVPEDWVEDGRAATEDGLLEIAVHLPAEAAEAVLNLAMGIRPEPARLNTPPRSVASTDRALSLRDPFEPYYDQPRFQQPNRDPFEHPDAQRRFRLLNDTDELRRALEFPWEKWTVFLHPAQREYVTRDFNGPARVTGSAGTGKTVVALHRAVRLSCRAG